MRPVKLALAILGQGRAGSDKLFFRVERARADMRNVTGSCDQSCLGRASPVNIASMERIIRSARTLPFSTPSYAVLAPVLTNALVNADSREGVQHSFTSICKHVCLRQSQAQNRQNTFQRTRRTRRSLISTVIVIRFGPRYMLLRCRLVLSKHF